jgi:hypothetical protein
VGGVVVGWVAGWQEREHCNMDSSSSVRDYCSFHEHSSVHAIVNLHVVPDMNIQSFCDMTSREVPTCIHTSSPCTVLDASGSSTRRRCGSGTCTVGGACSAVGGAGCMTPPTAAGVEGVVVGWVAGPQEGMQLCHGHARAQTSSRNIMP